MARITGIGGVFFKSRTDHKALAAWYEKHLGMPLKPWGGALLRWSEDQGEDTGVTVWKVGEPETAWFAPSTSPFMINYRVDDLGELLTNLRAAEIEILKGPESDENGTFAWISDPDGNKVELWEPRQREDRRDRSLSDHRSIR